MKDGTRAPSSGPSCERGGEGAEARERAGTHAREGATKGEGDSGRSTELGPGAWARVRARARVTAAPTGCTSGTDSWIVVPAMLCVRPVPIALPLIGRSSGVAPTLSGLRRGDLVEVEGELRLVNCAGEAGSLAVVVATVEQVGEVVAEAADEA